MPLEILQLLFCSIASSYDLHNISKLVICIRPFGQHVNDWIRRGLGRGITVLGRTSRSRASWRRRLWWFGRRLLWGRWRVLRRGIVCLIFVWMRGSITTMVLSLAPVVCWLMRWRLWLWRRRASVFSHCPNSNVPLMRINVELAVAFSFHLLGLDRVLLLNLILALVLVFIVFLFLFSLLMAR